MIEIIKFNSVASNISLIDRNHVNLTTIVVSGMSDSQSDVRSS